MELILFELPTFFKLHVNFYEILTIGIIILGIKIHDKLRERKS